jgi:hypothetical protein
VRDDSSGLVGDEAQDGQVLGIDMAGDIPEHGEGSDGLAGVADRREHTVILLQSKALHRLAVACGMVRRDQKLLTGACDKGEDVLIGMSGGEERPDRRLNESRRKVGADAATNFTARRVH